MNTATALVGIQWRGYRSGHFYVTLFDAEHRIAAVDALDHLKRVGSLPDYSPGMNRVEPFGCIELGHSSDRPVEHEGRKVFYLVGTETIPVGDD